VSPYLTTDLDVGDQLELRGPVGGWFVWDGTDPTPVLLVGGGSVATAKLRQLLAAGATVRVVAPEIARAIRQAAESPASEVTLLRRPFEPADIDDAWLVTARACECSAKRGMASIGSAADVIDSSRLPYIHDCRSRQSC